MKPIKVLCVIEGGILQSVWSDHPNVEVVVRDFDNIKVGDDDPFEGLTEIEIEKQYPYSIW
jgi:hypothetical protein